MHVPDSGRDYPVRLGRSMLNGSRIHFSMRFPNIPDTIANSAGTLERIHSDISAHLPLADGRGMEMQGSEQSTESSRIGEYFLVFHDGVFWLERCETSFHNLRATDEIDYAPDPPEELIVDPLRHDEWNAPDFAISPVTHHSSSEEETNENSEVEEKVDPVSTSSLPYSSTKLGESGEAKVERDIACSVDANTCNIDGRDSTIAHKGIGTKTVPRVSRIARKSIAGKSVPGHGASSSDESDACSDSDSDSDASSYTDKSSVYDRDTTQ